MDRFLSLVLLAFALFGLGLNVIGLILYLASFIGLLIGV